MTNLIKFREKTRWLGPMRWLRLGSAIPRIKGAIVTGAGLVTSAVTYGAPALTGLPIVAQIIVAAGGGLIAVGILSGIWHWLEGKNLSSAGQRDRLHHLYLEAAKPSLNHVRDLWNSLEEDATGGWKAMIRTLHGVVLKPLNDHEANLIKSFGFTASPPTTVIDHFLKVFLYYWRALLFVHAVGGFVGLTSADARYRATMKAHDEFVDAMRRLALMPGLGALRTVNTTLNNERRLIVTPWTVRYPPRP